MASTATSQARSPLLPAGGEQPAVSSNLPSNGTTSLPNLLRGICIWALVKMQRHTCTVGPHAKSIACFQQLHAYITSLELPQTIEHCSKCGHLLTPLLSVTQPTIGYIDSATKNPGTHLQHERPAHFSDLRQGKDSRVEQGPWVGKTTSLQSGDLLKYYFMLFTVSIHAREVP